MRQRIARYLVYLDRAKRVLWYVQSGVVILIGIKVLFGDWIDDHLLISLTGSFLTLPILAIVFGYIEKMRYRSYEDEDLESTNPSSHYISVMLSDIYGKLP